MRLLSTGTPALRLLAVALFWCFVLVLWQQAVTGSGSSCWLLLAAAGCCWLLLAAAGCCCELLRAAASCCALRTHEHLLLTAMLCWMFGLVE
jgi:hypothetical protein